MLGSTRGRIDKRNLIGASLSVNLRESNWRERNGKSHAYFSKEYAVVISRAYCGNTLTRRIGPYGKSFPKSSGSRAAARGKAR